MADRKSPPPVPDGPTAPDTTEVADWARRFGVTEDGLRAVLESAEQQLAEIRRTGREDA